MSKDDAAIELHKAVDELLEAKPDPSKVKALTASTLLRRETPYGNGDVFTTGYGTPAKQLEVQRCWICGALIPFDIHAPGDPGSAANVHIQWHNNIERRLLKLEQ